MTGSRTGTLLIDALETEKPCPARSGIRSAPTARSRLTDSLGSYLKYGKNSRLICVVMLACCLAPADELSRARPYVLTTATTGALSLVGVLLRLLRMRSWPRATAFP